MTARLVQSLQSASPSWKSHYQVSTKTCTRDIKGLAVLVDSSQPDQWQDGLDIDLIMGSQTPAQDAQDAPEAQDAQDAQDTQDVRDAPAQDVQDAPAQDVQNAPAQDVKDAPTQDTQDAHSQDALGIRAR